LMLAHLECPDIAQVYDPRGAIGLPAACADAIHRMAGT